MKTRYFILAMLLCSCGTLWAQWFSNGSHIYNFNVGNVGIGTANPSEKLEVNGIIKIPVADGSDNNSPSITAISNDDFLYDSQYLNHYGFGFHNYDDGNGYNGINSYISGYYGFDVFTAGSNRLRINFNGNVGIGTTSPNAGLYINKAGTWGSLAIQNQYAGNVTHFDYPDGKNYIRGTTIIADAGGNVGIGTTSPINVLDVNGTARFRRQGSTTAGFTVGNDALSLRGWGANNPYIEWRNSDGTQQGYMGWNTNRLSLVLVNGYNFTVENGKVGIGTINPDKPLTIQGTGVNSELLSFKGNTGTTKWHWNLLNNGLNLAETGVLDGRLFIKEGGDIGIGTTSPDAKLAVKGAIHTQEVRVDLLGAVAPDFVFEPTYNLRSLAETERYINEHKHLPEIPSAAEMEANGMELKAMNLKLLQKVEELTLYAIEQQKLIQEMRTELNLLKNK